MCLRRSGFRWVELSEDCKISPILRLHLRKTRNDCFLSTVDLTLPINTLIYELVFSFVST